MKLELTSGWTVADYGDEAIRQTSGSLKIVLDNRAASFVLDSRSNTTREEIRIAFYPLALWFATNWWRQRWEPAHVDKLPSTSWRMSHEMAAAGYGYTWPRISISSDGETTEVHGFASERGSAQSVQYLLDASEVLISAEFERVVDDFVGFVQARLDDVGVRSSDLHSLWAEVQSERRDTEASRYRQIEAKLGFDPDEAPSSLVERIIGSASAIGETAISEVASVCAGHDPDKTFTEIYESSKQVGIPGELAIDPSFILAREIKSPLPWDRGYKLATTTRAACGIPPGPIKDSILGDLFKLQSSVFRDDSVTVNTPHLGLAIHEMGSSKLKLLFRRRVPESRRFETARLVADCLTAPASDLWYPATDFKTARQKLQRAFAAELLCPVADLQEFLNDDFSDERLDEAGEYFQVSPLIAKHQRDNRLLTQMIY